MDFLKLVTNWFVNVLQDNVMNVGVFFRVHLHPHR